MLMGRIDMAMDQDVLRRKNEDLSQNVREKNRKLLQTQELYDKLKRRDMLGQVQNAASDAVDHTIHASVTANRLADRAANQNHGQRLAPLPPSIGTQNSAIQYPAMGHAGGGGPSMAPPTSRTGSGNGNWVGLSGPGNTQRM